MLVAAVVLIVAALLCYSTGVWAERARRRLLPWHAAFFALGFACDLSGTLVMIAIASRGARATTALSQVLTGVMAVAGSIALALMAVHLLWAVVTLVRRDERELRRFHRYSLLVWSIWLIPFAAGALAANAP